MSENIKEKESESYSSYQLENNQGLKAELNPLPDLPKQESDNNFDGFEGKVPLSRVRESACRLQSRLSSGRGIF